MTEAKAHLSALMARIGYGGERFVIERRGRPLAALVGAWAEAEERDLGAVVAEIYAERGRDTGRPVDLGA